MKAVLVTVLLGITLLVAASLALAPIERASTVHTFLLTNIGSMVTSQDVATDPTSASPKRVFVTGADGRFFNGRIVFTVQDDVDVDSNAPRAIVQVFNGVSYVTTINATMTDDGSATQDLPLTGFDPVGTATNQETFRIFLETDTTATVRYVFVAHTQS